MYRLAFNTTPQPILIDSAGRTLEAFDWAAVETTDPAVKTAVEAGRLVWAQSSPDGDLAAAANDRAAAFGQLDRPALADLAVAQGLLDPQDEPPAKGDLLTLLVPSDAPPPSRNTPGKPDVTTNTKES